MVRSTYLCLTLSGSRDRDLLPIGRYHPSAVITGIASTAIAVYDEAQNQRVNSNVVSPCTALASSALSADRYFSTWSGCSFANTSASNRNVLRSLPCQVCFPRAARTEHGSDAALICYRFRVASAKIQAHSLWSLDRDLLRQTPSFDHCRYCSPHSSIPSAGSSTCHGRAWRGYTQNRKVNNNVVSP